jgi:hypothetical protein
MDVRAGRPRISLHSLPAKRPFGSDRIVNSKSQPGRGGQRPDRQACEPVALSLLTAQITIPMSLCPPDYQKLSKNERRGLGIVVAEVLKVHTILVPLWVERIGRTPADRRS